MREFYITDRAYIGNNNLYLEAEKIMAKVYLKRIMNIRGCDGCYFYRGLINCSRSSFVWEDEKDKYNGCTCSEIPFIYKEVSGPEEKINV